MHSTFPLKIKGQYFRKHLKDIPLEILLHTQCSKNCLINDKVCSDTCNPTFPILKLFHFHIVMHHILL